MFRELFGKIHPSVFLKAAKAAATSISEHEQRLVELCQPTSEEALRRLGVGEIGLSAEAVEKALRQYGPNVLSQSKKTGVIVEILQRCKNPLVIQLLVICAVSLLMGSTALQHPNFTVPKANTPLGVRFSSARRDVGKSNSGRRLWGSLERYRGALCFRGGVF